MPYGERIITAADLVSAFDAFTRISPADRRDEIRCARYYFTPCEASSFDDVLALCKAVTDRLGALCQLIHAHQLDRWLGSPPNFQSDAFLDVLEVAAVAKLRKYSDKPGFDTLDFEGRLRARIAISNAAMPFPH